MEGLQNGEAGGLKGCKVRDKSWAAKLEAPKGAGGLEGWRVQSWRRGGEATLECKSCRHGEVAKLEALERGKSAKLANLRGVKGCKVGGRGSKVGGIEAWRAAKLGVARWRTEPNGVRLSEGKSQTRT